MEVATDEQVWKKLYEKHRNRRASADNTASSCPTPSLNRAGFTATIRDAPPELPPNEDYLRAGQALESMGRSRIPFPSSAVSPPTSRSKFKHNYLVESAWRKGGRMTTTHITPDQGVVTSLHLTKKYIVVALDNAKIHVFSTSGQMMRTLSGHVMGVWAMVPWGDTLVSGGCDREVRVWDMTTGKNKHILRGHTSTVRCLKMSDEFTAVSGSRDTSIRVWDITTGQCKHVLVGHQASVRCLEIHGDTIISGSYDTTARIWSLKDGSCLRTLQGHFSQIYAVAFDGKRVATGSLDTSVRIWDPNDGYVLSFLCN
jgi:F-box and WD-40 domain protein CDC4